MLAVESTTTSIHYLSGGDPLPAWVVIAVSVAVLVVILAGGALLRARTPADS